MEILKRYLHQYILGGILLTTIFIWSAVFANEQGDTLTVAFLDVGQGDSIFIEAPNGNQILIDGGSNRAVLRELSNFMPFYDRSIDVVVATHPDKDHIGGLPDILKRYKVELFLEPGISNDTGAYTALIDIIEERQVKSILARRGMKIYLDENIYLDILFPDRDVSEIESNTGSIVMQLVYGETKFLFTGDSPKSIEKYLVGIYSTALQSDVLKAGHHGSKTSSAEVFVGVVSPTYAIISAGEDNRYGHPHEEVINIFKQFEATILNTAETGTIVFTSDGESVHYLK